MKIIKGSLKTAGAAKEGSWGKNKNQSPISDLKPRKIRLVFLLPNTPKIGHPAVLQNDLKA